MTRGDGVPHRREPIAFGARAEAAEIGQSTLRQNGIFRAVVMSPCGTLEL
jgi:hypothetical protein